MYKRQGIAQLVEQLICNQQVVGSSPIASSSMGRYPSGQRDQTVNLTASPSKVRILLSPPNYKWVGCEFLSLGSSVVERFLGKEKVGSSTLLSGSRYFKDSR